MKPVWIVMSALVVAITLSPVIGGQQHSYSAADIQAGARLYDTGCGSCHGQAGDAVQGVNFSRGLFKSVRSDEDIVRVIQKGVPNTGMPPSSFSDAQANTLVAYLRSMPGGVASRNAALAGSSNGDRERGKVIVEGKGGCLVCHRIGAAGGGSGPVLGNLPASAPSPNPDQVTRSIIDPSAEMAPQYRIYQVVTRSGETVRGTALNLDTFTVQMRDANGNLRSFIKAEQRETGYVASPMPSFKEKLTPQEVADVVSYLISLR
jgi:putative heme-binding domain-containing protein